MTSNRVDDSQLAAVVSMIERRAEAADLTGDEVTLDALEMMALDLYEARQEIARLRGMIMDSEVSRDELREGYGENHGP